MWPWGHAAVGYLAYTAWTRLVRGRPPAAGATIALGFGTQFPDLVDKPLAWTFDVLPNGRSLGHSVFVAALLLAVGWVVLARFDRADLAGAFGVGHLSHLAGDAVYPLVHGEFGALAFMGWPVLPPVSYETDRSLLGHFLGMTVTPYVAFQFLLALGALAIWYRDGTPGVGVVRGWITPGDGEPERS